LGACFLALAACLLSQGAWAQFSGNADNDLTKLNGTSTTGADSSSGDMQGGADTVPTTRLRQTDATRNARMNPQPEPSEGPLKTFPYQAGEFELYVQQQAGDTQGRVIRRFGAELLTDPFLTSAVQDPLPSVPGDYIIRPGDEITVTIWGTVDADLRLTVDRAGRIAIPRVGAIDVAGLKSANLSEALRQHVAQVFKNFQLTATLGQVRAIRVFVTGYAEHRGSITINGLASVLHVIMRAGGPSSSGSFRDIHLLRNGHEIATFDLYELLLKGKRDTDQLVQPDDVIFIGPVGPQVAIVGSVNEPAIYEMKPGEVLDDVLRMAGGFGAVADRSRVVIERLADRNLGQVTELKLPEHGSDAVNTGDLIRVFSVITAALPKLHQNERVHVDGEVLRPGDYVLPPGSHVVDALRVAGGLTAAAYPFGTDFRRESVRLIQQVNYQRALRDLETDMAKSQATQRASNADELTAQTSAATSNARLLDRLRQIQPTGRVVLEVNPSDAGLPDLALEDGDSINIPSRNSSVGVFGSVFNDGNFLFSPGHTTTQYLRLAGGAKRGADKDSIFMIRANGSVLSAREGSSFWHSSSAFNDAIVEPGDTIFVPEEINKSTFVQDAKDWTQILYQFGLGLAGIKTLGL
jgi:protein involved in polysaccharide export with SLBB domain